MMRSARLLKAPTKANESVGNEVTPFEGTSTVCDIETGSVTSSNSVVLLEDKTPSKKSSSTLCIYPGGLNIQFWSWRYNNCAPTVFMVSMELVFEQLRIVPNDVSLFGRVLKTRCDEPKPDSDFCFNTFDLFHEQMTGKRNLIVVYILVEKLKTHAVDLAVMFLTLPSRSNSRPY